jgi:hypothetical protein
MMIKRTLTYLAVGGLVLLPVGNGRADNPGIPAQFDAQADVEIVDLITIEENENLDFGTVAKPSSGTTDFTVGTDGSMTVAGSDGQAISGHQPGQYDVSGTDSAPYTFTVTPGSCDDAGLTLGTMTNSAGPTLDDMDVKVGGTLTVNASTEIGNHTCNYQVTANYS